ncbi:unnamed protein product, partial [Symbiodinium sp. CCMP2456]
MSSGQHLCGQQEAADKSVQEGIARGELSQLRMERTPHGNRACWRSGLACRRCLQVPGGCSRQLGGWRRRLCHPLCADLRAS